MCNGVERLHEVDCRCPHFDSSLVAFLVNLSVRRLDVFHCVVVTVGNRAARSSNNIRGARPTRLLVGNGFGEAPRRTLLDRVWLAQSVVFPCNLSSIGDALRWCDAWQHDHRWSTGVTVGVQSCRLEKGETEASLLSVGASGQTHHVVVQVLVPLFPRAVGTWMTAFWPSYDHDVRPPSF